MQWKHSTSSAPKKAKVVSSAGKVMASVFWDTKGIVFIDYLQNGKTINGEYYAKLLRELPQAIKSKWSGKLTKGVLLHQDNAPAHKAQVAMSAVHDCGFELIDHTPYSPDLAPSDYFLFKIMLKNKPTLVKYKNILCQSGYELFSLPSYIFDELFSLDMQRIMIR